MNIKSILEEAKKLIEIGWAQEAIARDKNNTVCSPWAATATKWCAIGAIQRSIMYAMQAMQC